MLPMDLTPPSVFSAEELSLFQAVALELEDPELPATRRVELLHAIEEIAERYACDPRLAGN